MADVQRTSPDPELEALRKKWAPEWPVWRSRNGEGEPNEWCATHRDPSMTVITHKALADDPVRRLIGG